MLLKHLCAALILAATAMTANAQQTISGKIVDEKANPVAGASVYVLNTQRGTVTDRQGVFELRNILPGNYILHVSAIGFAEITREITEKNMTGIELSLPLATIHLDEVIVSAQKREESLRQLPFSISAFRAKKVEDYRLWEIKDISALVPNLYMGNPGDDRNVTSVRGVTSTSYDPAVATYVDGVNQFNLDTYISPLFDIERIEVLRGPQGTLYGRNAMGGVINIITKKPTNTTSGFASVSFGNLGRQRYNASLRGALIKNKLFAGGSLLFDKTDGYYTNEFNNSSFDKQHALTGNYYLTYVASQKLTFTVNAKHRSNRNNGPFSLVNGVADAFANPYKLNQDRISKMIDNTFNASLSANYSGNRINFTSQTAWQTNRRYYTLPLDADFSPIDGVAIINNYPGKWNKVKAFTQEFRFTSPASFNSRLKWTTGIYFFHQSVPSKQATYFGQDAGFLGVPDTDFFVINTSEGKSTGGALYGQISYNITPRLELTTGLRYDHENKKQSVLGEYQKLPNPAFATRPDTSASANFNAFSPRLSLAYTFSKTTNGYLTYTRGYRAGGFTQLSSDPSQPPLYFYDPEYSNNYEAGIKNNFLNSRLYLNIAVFYTRISNAQVPTLVLPDAITITRNAGKLDSKGAELELLAKPARGLEIDYNFGYTHARYKTLKLSQNGAAQDFDNNRQVFTPDITSTLAAQYTFDLNLWDFKALIRGEWLALGTHYFDLANTIRQKGYSLLNTKFGVTGKNLDVFFWIRNITDKKYISYAYDFGAVHLGSPQTFGVTVTGRL
jgi:iron complex outermembrane recepter protein